MTQPVLRQILCPVALHPDGTPLRLPAILQPDGSHALVHCLEVTGERRAQTAANALNRQTGLETRDALLMGHDEGKIEDGALWHFYLCRIALPVREQWQFLGTGHGLNRLGWLELHKDPCDLGPVDRLVRHWIRSAL